MHFVAHSTHIHRSNLRSLIKAGYVAETREMKQRPQTSYALTKNGRKAFAAYITLLEAIVRSARG